MKIYILTSSAAYYPQSGADDWVGIYTDYDSAHKAYRELKLDAFDQYMKFLIKIEGADYTVVCDEFYNEDPT